MSNCSDTAGNAHSWGYVCSPPPTSSLTKTFSLLETAAEQIMVHTDFQAALGTCNKGLEGLASMELEDNRWMIYFNISIFPAARSCDVTVSVFWLCRCLEYKAGFCTVGIQALAELNQWRAALPWVLQQYEDQEKIPAQIMQLWWAELKIFHYTQINALIYRQYSLLVWFT